MLGPQSKREFYKFFERGHYGNRTRTSSNIHDFCESVGLCAIRTKHPGGRCVYDIDPEDLNVVWDSFLASGYTESDLNISEMAPTHQLVVQGEVMRSSRGIELLYSTLKLPMRRALATQSQSLFGLAASAFLQSRMDPGSWDWLQYLLDEYDADYSRSSVIEFSTFTCPCGIFAEDGYNTIFWEVRAGY